MKQQLRHGLPRLGGGGERLQLDIGQHFIAVARGCQFRKLRQAAPFCSPKRFSDGICLSSCEPPKTVHTAQSHLVQYSLLNARNAPIQHTSVPLGFYNLRSSVAPPQQRHSGKSELVIINALVSSKRSLFTGWPETDLWEVQTDTPNYRQPENRAAQTR